MNFYGNLVRSFGEPTIPMSIRRYSFIFFWPSCLELDRPPVILVGPCSNSVGIGLIMLIWVVVPHELLWKFWIYGFLEIYGFLTRVLFLLHVFRLILNPSFSFLPVFEFSRHYGDQWTIFVHLFLAKLLGTRSPASVLSPLGFEFCRKRTHYAHYSDEFSTILSKLVWTCQIFILAFSFFCFCDLSLVFVVFF